MVIQNKLVNDIVKDATNIFSFEYLQKNFSLYSTRHVLDVFDVFQKMFEDIPD